MGSGLTRLRRAAATALLGLGATAGTVAVTGGVAGASGGTVTLSPTSLPAAVSGDAYSETLTATDSVTPTSAGTATWTVTSGSLPPGLTLGSSPTSFATSDAESTDTLSGAPTTDGSYTFTVSATDGNTGDSGSQAYTVVVGPTSSVAASASDTVLPGKSDQAAGSWSFTLGNDFVAGQTLTIDIGPPGATTAQCQTSADYVAFDGTPTVSVSPLIQIGETTPSLTASVGTRSGDLPGCSDDQLILTVGDTASSGTTGWTVTVSGIAYTLGSATPTGSIVTQGTYAVASSQSASVAVAPDATVSGLAVSADNPPEALPPSATEQAISPVVLAESLPGTVSGTVTVALNGSGDTWYLASTPKVTTSPTGTGAGTAGAVTGMGTTTLSFTVTPSTSVATTYALSGLTVDSGATDGPLTATVTEDGTQVTDDLMVAEVSQAHEIYGSDADGTAAAELEQAFPYGSGTCPGTSSSRAVVLATDTNYPDALAGSFLARYLGTGELLTPVASISTETLDALRLEGITTVYELGGPLVVSAADIAQLKATDVYTCGGGSVVDGSSGSPETLTVQSVYGQTEYDTAMDVAEYAGPAGVGTADLIGAYGGQYNDTAGTQSSSPALTGALKTAILATGQGFQDAESASVLAYVGSGDSTTAPVSGNGDPFPILLTTPDALSSQAQDGLQSLGVQQVIVMGGPLAISDAVVSAVEALGISVIRVAGTDYTDTSQELARMEVATVNSSSQPIGLGWDPDGAVSVARGDFYSDGLAGAVVSATGTGAPNATHTCTPNATTGSVSACLGQPEPLLLTENPSTVGPYLTGFLDTAGSSAGVDGLGGGDVVTSFAVFGGPLAVTPQTIGTMQDDLGT